MRDFKIGDHAYRVTGRLNAFQQNHVVRKIGSVLVFLTQVKEAEVEGAKKVKAGKKTDAPAAPPITPRGFARAILATSGSLPDDAVDYVIGAALSVTSRQQSGGAWASLRSPEGELMFSDLGALDLNEIVYHVLLAHDLIEVFQDGPSGSKADNGQGRTSNGPNSPTGKASSGGQLTLDTAATRS